MGKIDKQILIKFGPEQPKEVYIQHWPTNSKFLKLIVQPDGIYTFFEVPEVLSVEKGGNLESEEWHFAIILGGGNTKEGDEFIDILTVYTEVTPEDLKEMGLPSDFQSVIIYPFFMRKRPKTIEELLNQTLV